MSLSSSTGTKEEGKKRLPTQLFATAIRCSSEHDVSAAASDPSVLTIEDGTPPVGAASDGKHLLSQGPTRADRAI
jgi:hypothetical protein